MKREDKLTLLLMVPGLALMLLFTIGPAGWAFFVSFTNQALLGPGAKHVQFIGLENYEALLNDQLFYNSIARTFEFVLGSAIAGQFLLGLLIAVLLRKKGIRGKGLVSMSLLLCYIIPEVVAAYLWSTFLDYDYGALNSLLRMIGLPAQRWILNLPMVSITMANVWRGTAFSVLLFSSAIESIPSDIYEAADVDGASSWKKFRFITFPLIRYSILLDLLLITLWTFAVFTMVFVLTGGGPSFRTELMAIYAYHRAFSYHELGQGSAISVFMLAFVLVLGGVYARFVRKTT